MTNELKTGRDGARARFLFVHAHPDDETLATGLTMAAYASRGHEVHVLTCTLGEEGEVIPPDLAHLGPGRDNSLGPWRREELQAAMTVLGVQHSVLGADSENEIASRYRDSGMAGTASSQHPDAFVRADLGEAAAAVAAHIEALHPDVVVTYDKQGGYSHPDHIQTHRVTMAALSSLSSLADRGRMPLAYVILTPHSWASQDRIWLRQHLTPIGSNYVVPQQDAPYPPSVVNDEVVTHVVEEPTLVAIQSLALAEHRTQVRVFDGYYALSNDVAARLSGREGFAQVDPVTGDLVPAAPGAPRHTGLLQGLSVGSQTQVSQR